MIVIIVDDDLERPKENANSFSNVNQGITYYYSNSRLYRQHKLDQKIIWTETTNGIKDINHKIDIAIIHNTHKSSWEQLCKTLQRELTFSTFLVRYSGAYNNNLVKQNEDWIIRSINSGTAITQSEAKDIIEYVKHCKKNGKENCTKPPILSKLSSPIYLSSLSILAQGYLITHCNLQKRNLGMNESYDSANHSAITNLPSSVQDKINDGDHGDDTNHAVKEALKKMGWDVFKKSSNYAKTIHADISEKKSDTQKTSWWLEPFDNMPVEDIHKQIVKEWDEKQGGETCDPAPVYRLLETFKQDTIENPEIIAEAYIAIAQKLGYHQPEISLPDNIDKLPNFVMILGNTPVAIALSQVLYLFDIEAFLYPTISEALSINLEYLQDPGEDISVITLADNPTETLRQLRYLRNHGSNAKFIAIAPNSSSQQKLKQLDVLGDVGRFKFAEMCGHISIMQPVLLCDLLLAPHVIEKKYIPDWKENIKKSRIGKLQEHIKMAEYLVANGDQKGAEHLVAEIVQEMSHIPWGVILPHHDHSKYHNDLIAPRDHYNRDYITKIRQILSIALGEV